MAGLQARVIIGAVLGTALAIGGTALPSSADNTDPDACTTLDCYRSAIGPVIMQNQLDLAGFNTALAAIPSAHALGYISSVDDVENRAVRVLWSSNASVPDDIGKLADKYDVELSIETVPWSYSGLRESLDDLLDYLKKSPLPGLQVSQVAAFLQDPDKPEVRVYGTYPSGIGTELLSAISAKFSLGSKIPIQLEEGEAVNTDGRYADYSPFNAGGFMTGDGGGACSAGFAFVYGTINKTTTARHCRASAYYTWDGNNKVGETVTYGNQGQSRVLVGRGSYHVFDGTTLSSTATETVTGYVVVSEGDRVCTDGGNSGLHCNLLVTSTIASHDDGYGSEATALVARQSDGISTIQGDSGGPIIMPVPSSTQVKAVGMIQYGWGTEKTGNCGTVKSAGSNRCWQNTGFTQIPDILDGLRATGRSASLYTP